MILLVLACVGFILALIPAGLFLINLFYYRSPAIIQGNENESVSVLIPARNEEESIQAAVESVLANEGVHLEVIVLDDGSEDNTARIVNEISRRDPRIRLVEGRFLPVGWAGKQHACYVLSQEAKHPYIVFMDADVRLYPSALRRMVSFMKRSGAALASGIPQQETVGILEKLLIPIIHFVLLGFLPMFMMRRSKQPGFGAGCGQLFIARKEDYQSMGGHSQIRSTFHDGIQLPRAFRNAGFFTDLFDATGLAVCRMYRCSQDLVRGLAKNAREGLASNQMLLPSTILFLGGQVMPLILLFCTGPSSSLAFLISCCSSLLLYLPRLISVFRFRQSFIGALLHPFGILLLMGIQWYAFIRAQVGRPFSWKGRLPVESHSNTALLKPSELKSISPSANPSSRV